MQVDLLPSRSGWTTSGLYFISGYELYAQIRDLSLLKECKDFLEFICNYILSGSKIKSGETIRYGYWLTKIDINGQRGCFFEYNEEATEFIPGIDITLGYWKSQHEVCLAEGASFLPPSPDQLVVVSAGVIEGSAVTGVRYPSPSHMSGWWLTTHEYNGDVDTLRLIHAYHLTKSRPDLARYLALPHGFRIYSGSGRAWLDNDVQHAPP